MNDSVRRRGRGVKAVLRAGIVALLLVPALIGFTVPAQAAKDTNCGYSLVGTWEARVRTSLPSSGETTFVFRADGTIEPPAGEPVTDTWSSVTCNRFVFDIEHPHYNGAGEVDGEVRGHQDGFLVRDWFVSRGTSVTYDLNGQVVRSFDVEVLAQRVTTP